MRVIGLTGGIGSGKSTVAALLAGLGATVVDADAVARRLQRRGAAAWARVRAVFGWPVLDPEGQIARARLARRVFGDGAARERLNAVLLPLIRDAMLAEVDEAGRGGVKVVVLEAPLLFESGLADRCDEVWVVDAPLEVRLARLKARGLFEADARERMRAQMPDDERRQRAGTVIPNGGDLKALEQAVIAAWRNRGGGTS